LFAPCQLLLVFFFVWAFFVYVRHGWLLRKVGGTPNDWVCSGPNLGIGWFPPKF
jgi:hypothetical protein